ncbi:HEAT repeat domain-containing protein [Bradymonadaceae bacterium TMQ3]|nr:HEAT repeat domain-containing protein [Bradymonadaceae bacterium TMQ3]TXC75909.1 HEAT repeat domain-containing protein [Bradymonadales bacterium TMQ1]
MRSILTSILLALTLVMGAASPAIAQHNHALEADANFDDFLNTVDALPTPEVLERFPDAETRLLDVATDAEATVFRRWRATSMLSNFNSPEVRQALITLTEAADDDLRGMALLVLGAGYLEGGNAEVLATIEARLSDDDASVRADAVRALAYGHGPQITERLERIAAGDDARQAKIATRALARMGHNPQ